MSFDERELRELKEAAQARIDFRTLDEVTGVPIEQLGIQAEVRLLREFKERPSAEIRFRKKRELSSDMPIQDLVEAYVQEHVQSYQRSVETRSDDFRMQAYTAMRLAASRGYISGERQLHLVMTDQVLASGSDVGSRSRYDSQRRRVEIVHDVSAQIVAHEVGHCLSHSSVDEHQIGFGRMGKTKDQITFLRTNWWFDEGVTVLWEEEAGMSVVKRGAEDPYAGFRDVVEFILQETQTSLDGLFRAYFQQEGAREELERRLRERFGVTVNQLDVLSLRLDPEWKIQVLQGASVSVHRPMEDQTELQEKVRELLRLFPNVTIK